MPRSNAPLAHLAPNWFATVMGTGIVANAAALLPHRDRATQALATGAWLLASALLAGLLVAWTVHWVRHREIARSHLASPTMAPFYGAPPMALMTVGAATLLVGSDVIGHAAAIRVDVVLWTAGTLLGLMTSALIPYVAFTRHAFEAEDVSAAWLMPVVPPMVSAATGAALVAALPEGSQARLTLLLACYAMFGLSLLATLVVLPLLWGRLMRRGVGTPALVPTLWIVLGPLGQSITAAGLLAHVAPGSVAEPYATGLRALGVVYGAPTWGFAALWVAIALGVTVRTARLGLPFSLGWWSFTFPVGTFVTGTSILATQTGSVALGWIAVGLYGGLVVAWLTAATRTVRGALGGRLALAPLSASPARSATPLA